MEFEDVSPALQQRLGPHATAGLLATLAHERQEWTEDVMRQAVDRFEQRLAEATSQLRVAIAEGDAALRVEMAHLREELRAEMGAVRLDMTRWTFGLWVGQLVATAAIVAGMFQIFLT